MAKIKLTKGELKKQRDSLKQFERYLPTLLLKKQQLQMKILETNKILEEQMNIFVKKEKCIQEWVGLLGDSEVDLKQWITPIEIITGSINIAGANVPVFMEVKFKEAEYDLYTTPFWIDEGIEELRDMVQAMVEVKIVQKRIKILEKELRTTSQRVNLFEKIKIPECKESIRKIGIYLGDQQANAVGVSKVTKKKIDQKNLELAAV